MSEFVAVTYRKSEKFNMEVIEKEGEQFVKVWAPYSDLNNMRKENGLICIKSNTAIVPIIRLFSCFVSEEHDDGTLTYVYIFEVEDADRFRSDACKGTVACLFNVFKLDNDLITAYRAFYKLSLSKITD